MAVINTSIRFPEEQYKAINQLAELYGESVTNFMRQTILDRLEDETDYQEALKVKSESKGQVVSRNEIMKRLGM